MMYCFSSWFYLPSAVRCCKLFMSGIHRLHLKSHQNDLRSTQTFNNLFVNVLSLLIVSPQSNSSLFFFFVLVFFESTLIESGVCIIFSRINDYKRK